MGIGWPNHFQVFTERILACRYSKWCEATNKEGFWRATIQTISKWNDHPFMHRVMVSFRYHHSYWGRHCSPSATWFPPNHQSCMPRVKASLHQQFFWYWRRRHSPKATCRPPTNHFWQAWMSLPLSQSATWPSPNLSLDLLNMHNTMVPILNCPL